MVNGVTLDFGDAGHGAPLLLAHGFTGSAASWSGLAPTLRQAHRVIAVDLLGHGRSDTPHDPDRYAIERQADDLAALLDALDIETADVIGYSMGARIALVLAMRHAARVGRLVLESPSAGLIDDEERARRRVADEALADRIERDGIIAFVDEWESRPMFASHSALPLQARSQLREERLGQRPSGLAGSLRGAGQGTMAPLRDRLSGVACPVLIIVGELDSVGVERAQAVAEGIAGALLEVVAGSGHTPHLERPDVFLDLAAGFLAAAETKHPH